MPYLTEYSKNLKVQVLLVWKKALFSRVFQNIKIDLNDQKFSANSQNIYINVVCEIIRLHLTLYAIICQERYQQRISDYLDFFEQ